MGLGVGNLPAALYLNGGFSGVGNIFINRLGFSLDADPIADILAPGFGLRGPGQGTSDFYLGAGDIENPFSVGYAVGSIDFSTLRFVAVPEPATFLTLIPTLGLLRRIRGRGRAIVLHEPISLSVRAHPTRQPV